MGGSYTYIKYIKVIKVFCVPVPADCLTTVKEASLFVFQSLVFQQSCLSLETRFLFLFFFFLRFTSLSNQDQQKHEGREEKYSSPAEVR